MGYTHYWKQAKPLTINAEQKALIKGILEEHKDILRGGMGTGKPKFTGAVLSFNGDETQGHDHETFQVEFKKVKDFDFCKTAYKPYDIAACKCLLVLSLSEGFTFSSDGEVEFGDGTDNWGKALYWAKEKGITPNLKEA